MVNRLYVFVIAILVIVLDQVSKYIVFKKLLLGEQVSVVDNVISLTKAYNTGAAFSILQDRTNLLILFSVVVTIIIIGYLIFRIHQLPILSVLSWGFILGGTIGNMIDRLGRGYVIDFIRFDFINFPIFNLADLFINIGAIIILTSILLRSGKKPQN